MTTTPFHVVIVGGGIGGLCLAQGLKRAGVSVAVYERDRTRADRLQGYRIHINPDGSRALHACLPPDLYNAFVATCGLSNTGFTFLTEKMETLLALRTPDADGPLDPVESHKSASRVTLRQVLLSGLGGIVHFDKAFTRYERTADGKVTAFFADGTEATGDVLVGADGGGSRVRAQYLPDAERVDTGLVGIAGKVPLTPESRALLPPTLLDGPATVLAPKGRGMFIAVQEFRHGPRAAGDVGGNDDAFAAHDGLLSDTTADYIMWAFLARREAYGFPDAPERMDADALHAVMRRMIAGWHPRFRELVRLSDPGSTAPVTIRSAPPEPPRWETTNVTLLGDAIHSMTPFRGIGANTALRDAALLCENLVAAHAGQKPLLDAIRDYETRMVEYGFAAVRSSYAGQQRIMVDSPLKLAGIKTVFRLINALPPLRERMARNFGND